LEATEQNRKLTLWSTLGIYISKDGPHIEILNRKKNFTKHVFSTKLGIRFRFKDYKFKTKSENEEGTNLSLNFTSSSFVLRSSSF
jgi:hypothetical protein